MPKKKNAEELQAIKKRNEITGLRLKKFRSCNGLKQINLAKILGFTEQYVSMMERGIKPLTIENAQKIKEKYPQVRTEWLLGLGPDDLMTDQQEYKQRIEQAVDAMKFQEEFDEAVFRATQLIILSTLGRDDKNPRIDEDGESIIYDDYAPTGKTSDEYGSETELKPFRISSGWIDNFSGEVAAYAEFLFNRKALNYRAEFEEVK